MTGWAAKRFWKAASAVQDGEGWAVALDGRPVRTPAKALLRVPTRAMAEAIAAEWDAQQGLVRPETMPLTRAANSAIDKVAVQYDEVAALIAAYGESDLLCYRAEGPEVLAARQAAAWDPLLVWCASDLRAALVVTRGVMPVAQSAEATDCLRDHVRRFDAYRLTALHDLVAISGSLVLGLAVVRGRLDPDSAWTIARIDETWQAEVWGLDEEAAEAERVRRQAFDAAARFHALCSG